MSHVLVSGLTNVETTCKVAGFPIDYHPSQFNFFGVRSAVSGVGYNIAAALTALGQQVRLLSQVGDDQPGELVRQALRERGIDDTHITSTQRETAQSVVLYDESGRRMIYSDIKDAQEQPYELGRCAEAMRGCRLAVLCNINYSRPMLPLALEAGVPIVSDVHLISDLDDDYNRDFMAAATVLFQSHERLPVAPHEWARLIFERHRAELVVIGMGGEGALLVERGGALTHAPAVTTRPIVSTVGAGDALLSGFVHGYVSGMAPADALRQAVIFAGHKIGVAGAGQGFASATELRELVEGMR